MQTLEERKEKLYQELMELVRATPRRSFNNPKDLYLEYLFKHRLNKQEGFYVFMFNSANEVLKFSQVSLGTMNQCLVHPRLVYRQAILCNACSIIVAHNHPSGNHCSPSAEDFEITRRLKKAGELIGIELLDHIIFSKNGYMSFLEQKKL